MYRIRYYPLFQASTGGLGTYPTWIRGDCCQCLLSVYSEAVMLQVRDFLRSRFYCSFDSLEQQIPQGTILLPRWVFTNRIKDWPSPGLVLLSALIQRPACWSCLLLSSWQIFRGPWSTFKTSLKIYHSNLKPQTEVLMEMCRRSSVKKHPSTSGRAAVQRTLPSLGQP